MDQTSMDLRPRTLIKTMVHINQAQSEPHLLIPLHDTITSSMQSEDVAETIELPGRFLNAFEISSSGPKSKKIRKRTHVYSHCSSFPLLLEIPDIRQSRNPKEETEET